MSRQGRLLVIVWLLVIVFFSEVKRRITHSDLKTREAVVKFLKDKGVDCDNNNLSDDDAVKVSELMELIDSMQKIKEEAKKKANMPAKISSNQQSKKNKPEANPALTNKELKEIEEEAKKNAENLRKEGAINKEETKAYEKLEIERLKNEKLKSLEQPKNIPDGYKLKNVKGDGNCLYRAIARIVKGNENNYHDIRNSAVGAVDGLLKGIKDFKDLYEVHDNCQLSGFNESLVNEVFDGIPFMGIFRQASDYKGGDVKTIKNALDILAEIKKSLSTDKEFGGAAELYFISVAIKRPLVIYNNDGTIAGYSPGLKVFIDRDNISWLDDDDTKVMVHRKDNHFQALVKK